MLRAFELNPHPEIPTLTLRTWTVMDCYQNGQPEDFGMAQVVPIFSSAEAAEVCMALDSHQPEALLAGDFAQIERFCSQGGYGLHDFLEYRRASA